MFMCILFSKFVCHHIPSLFLPTTIDFRYHQSAFKDLKSRGTFRFFKNDFFCKSSLITMWYIELSVCEFLMVVK